MKNQITFLILFIVLGFSGLQAQVTQEWVARYSGSENSFDYASSLVVDGSGNVYVTGGSQDDYATIKYNSSGIQQWIQIYNGPGNSSDYPAALAVDNSGNVYVTGSSIGNGTYYDYATIKYNSSGDSLWVQRYNGSGTGADYARSLAVDDSGNVYVTGGIGNTGLWSTIKYNSSGVQQWIKIENNCQTPALVIDDSANVYVTGIIYDASTHFDFATIKYNSSGVQQWFQRYNGPGNHQDIACSLAVDSSGNVYVTGSSTGTGTSYSDFATIKYNSSGVQQWVQRYNGLGGPSAIGVDRSGNVYVTGYSSVSISDYTTIKYNSKGVQEWVQLYNGGGASSLAIDGSGNVYVTGHSGGVPISDYRTIMYNSAGIQQWIQIYNGPSDTYDHAASIAVDDSGSVYVTGSSSEDEFRSDYITIKYSQTDGITSPSKLKAQSVDSSYIKVIWQDNSNDEDGFYIERSKINDASHWEVIDVVTQNVNSYSDYFISRGLKYYYRVNAYSGNIYSGYSNIDSAILGGNPSFIPAPPSNLVLHKRTANTISMGWLDNSGNENGFIIFRKTDQDLFFEIVDSVSTDVVTYQEVGVSPGRNYFYKVCSFNQSGISDYSNTLIVLAFIKTHELEGNHVLSGNYPNPFNPVTNLEFGISKWGFVSLKIYDMLGKEVATLVDANLNPGTYKYNFDASFLSSGVYFYKLAVDGNIIDTKRMMLLK